MKKLQYDITVGPQRALLSPLSHTKSMTQIIKTFFPLKNVLL